MSWRAEKTDTVNVIEKTGEAQVTIHSFHEDRLGAGNMRAEECFFDKAQEHDPKLTDEDVNICLDNGYYEQGDYQLFLVHSE
jgi:hypothetical protein